VASVDQNAWSSAYISELRRYHQETPDRIVNSIFFGGGTPSLMDPKLVETVIGTISDLWRMSNNVEITLEANPGSVEAGKFNAFRSAGVNRVSLGLQALNDQDLRLLGRLHTAQEGRTALSIAQSVFDRVSFDLIYARQHQTPDDWASELGQALAFGTDHVSLYQLTIEDGTAYGKRFSAGSLPGLPADDTAADMYEITTDLTSTAGLSAYEVSNHARPGAESRHNLIYWKGGDYVGVGPGAHGRLTIGGVRFATETPLLPQTWLKSVAGGSGETIRDRLSRSEWAEEFLLMGLRLTEGISLSRYGDLAGYPVSQHKINGLAESGFVIQTGDTLRATSKGRIVLNAVLRELLAGEG